MIRAHKIRLNPTPEQEQHVRQAAGTARFCSNWGLQRVKAMLDAGQPIPNVRALRDAFKRIRADQFPWTCAVGKSARDGAFVNLGRAITNSFDSRSGRRAGKRVGFPRFKSRKHGYGSFSVANDRLKVDGHTLTIQKVGAVNMTEPLRFAGKILGANVSYRADSWFVSIQVELPTLPRTAPERVLSVDLGIKALAVDSDGEVFENQKHLAAAQKKLRRLNRWLARKHQGSQNWQKAKRKLARLHLRIANLRADAIHKLTTRLAQKASTIALETLNVVGMRKNHRLARAIADAAFAEMVRQLGYKAAQVVRIDPFYRSSKRCNACGHINHDLTLDQRAWHCPGCGAHLDRDANAARNIRDKGMRLAGA